MQRSLCSNHLAHLRQGFVGQPSLPFFSSWLASSSCEAAKAGGGERDRTDDLLRAKQALSQLSYTPDLDSVAV